jgi:hypothetical protein
LKNLIQQSSYVAISANIAAFLFQVLVVKEDFFNSLMIIVFLAIVIPVLGAI